MIYCIFNGGLGLVSGHIGSELKCVSFLQIIIIWVIYDFEIIESFYQKMSQNYGFVRHYDHKWVTISIKYSINLNQMVLSDFNWKTKQKTRHGNSCGDALTYK